MTEWEFEMASKMEEDERNSRLAIAAKNAIPSGILAPENFKSEECEECGDDLDLFRKQHGLTICVGGVCRQKRSGTSFSIGNSDKID